MQPIKLGVLGTGHLGTHHTRILSQLPGAELVGIHDPDRDKMSKVSTEYGTRAFNDVDEMLALCEAVVVASPTATHRVVAEKAFLAGCQVLVEKPLADIASEGSLIVNAAAIAGKTLMVGHIEQFNPAFEAARPIIDKPLFVESHRLTAYRGRGLDVSVVHDLLIHDLELLLAILDDEVVSMDASARPILTDSPDIANVRLRFSGGCVANLTASRISLSNMRKMRLFQLGAYISIDFGEKTVEIATLGGGPEPPAGARKIELTGGESINLWNIDVPETDALTSELEHFLQSISFGSEPRVSGKRGLKALELAEEIIRTAGE